MSKGRVVVAMSGGVDSSVAAYLLHQQGYQVLGVTMRLYSVPEADLPAYYQGCCTLDDVEDARRVCARLGVPHYVWDVRDEFRRHVMDYFVAEYQRGRTPHPCIACNDTIKFGFLLRRARALDADFVATGHYARITRDAAGRYHLARAADPRKDQSYVLFGMGQEELARTLFPVGHLAKEEVRRLAANAALPVAQKPDSQEICFVPWGDYRRFIAQRAQPRPGPIVDTTGRVLGHHQGIEFFTVGQRRGLNVPSPHPLFVLRLEPEAARVVVGQAHELLADALWADTFRYVSGHAPAGPIKVTARVRYKSPEAPATLYPAGGRALLRFQEPQRAITPGQAVVVYQDDEVLGGGFIAGPATAADASPLLTATAMSS